MPSPFSKRLSVFSSVVTDNAPHSSFLLCSALTHCLNLARQWLHSHSLSPVQQTACCKQNTGTVKALWDFSIQLQAQVLVNS